MDKKQPAINVAGFSGKMKTKIILALAILGMSFASCKKVYYNTDGKEVVAGEPLSKSYIESKTWIIVKAERYPVRVWKLRADGTETIITIEDVPDNMFDQPEYALWHTITGNTVAKLNIKY